MQHTLRFTVRKPYVTIDDVPINGKKESEKRRMMGNQSIDLSKFLCTRSDAWTRLVQSSII